MDSTYWLMNRVPKMAGTASSLTTWNLKIMLTFPASRIMLIVATIRVGFYRCPPPLVFVSSSFRAKTS